jgi:hypothetical protein
MGEAIADAMVDPAADVMGMDVVAGVVDELQAARVTVAASAVRERATACGVRFTGRAPSGAARVGAVCWWG